MTCRQVWFWQITKLLSTVLGLQVQSNCESMWPFSDPENPALTQDSILAPGNGYTGGHVWTQSSQGDDPSSEWLGMIKDPINNTGKNISIP
jgi:hypothetical protein